jgi:hypothetical protein
MQNNYFVTTCYTTTTIPCFTHHHTCQCYGYFSDSYSCSYSKDADYDRGGELSTEEVFAWFGEPITPFSKSIFRLADMDDSGLIDFCEFVKVVLK